MKKHLNLTLQELLRHPDNLVRSEAKNLERLLELLEWHEEEKQRLIDPKKISRSV